MDYTTINLDAAKDALRVIGGDQLVAATTAIYWAINEAGAREMREGLVAVFKSLN